MTTTNNPADVKETSNEYYGRINARFECREKFLYDIGFKYVIVPELNIAVFTRKQFGKARTLAAGWVQAADERMWRDQIEIL